MGNPRKVGMTLWGEEEATERADFGGNAAKGAKAKFATTKFRQKSQQEQAAASKLRMEKRDEKTGGRPGKAGKAEAAQTKRPDP